MISRFLSLDPFFTKNKALKKFMNYFSITQIFYPLQSMAYTENLGLCHYVGFSQMQSVKTRHNIEMHRFNFSELY